MTRMLLLLVLLLLPAGPASAAPPSTLRETSLALQEFTLDAFPTEVPAGVKPLLTLFKHQLRDVVQEALNAEPAGPLQTERVRQGILQRLEREGLAVGIPDDFTWDRYGLVSGVDVHDVPGHSDLAVATTEVSVGCGSDTSFYLLRRQGESWNLLLAQEANGYDRVDGARSNLKYLISDEDDAGRFYIVTASENEWCSSCWQSLRYAVMRAGPQPYEPRVLDSRDFFFYRCGGYELQPTESGFVLELIDNLENTDFERRAIRYVVDGDEVRCLDKTRPARSDEEESR